MATDIQARIAAAKARKAQAEAAITDDDRAELAARDELSRLEAEAAEQEETKRALDLARRLDLVQSGGEVAAKSLQVKGSSHNFVIKNPGAAAYNLWTKGIQASVTADVTGEKSKVDRANVARAYAAAAVCDWNGITDFTGATENGNRLLKFLEANPAIADDIANVATDLAKAAAEERKS